MGEQVYKNFVEVIKGHAKEDPEIKVLTFIPTRGDDRISSEFGHLHEKAKAIAGFLHENAKQGDRALLIYEQGIEFIYGFMGCLYAGVIAVPVFPPTFSNMALRLNQIIHDATPSICLADGTVCNFIEEEKEQHPIYKSLKIVNTEQLESRWADNYRNVALDHHSLAFLQYTSGSTGNPKGVMVTHGNLLHNEEFMRHRLHHDKESFYVNWMPLYHDMGLIGCVLQACYVGFPIVFMSAQRFLRSPLSWLKTISEYKATISGGPNFGYELCIRAASAKRIENLDLGNWRIAFTGAEPVRHKTIQRFVEVFGPCGFRPESVYPCYGLAEATLMVTGNQELVPYKTICADKNELSRSRVVPAKENSENGLILVSNGTGGEDQKVIIVDPDKLKPCKEEQIGEIWMQGPSVAAGYWENPQATEETFKACLADGDGPYFRTGDMGFLSQGELYISGRLKDIIILNGRNYYPQDIETAVEGCNPRIRFGRVAAFSISDDMTEKLCIVAESKAKQKEFQSVFNDIRLSVSRDIGVKADEVILVKSRTLPFTTSGKIRRRETRRMYLEGRLEIVASLDALQFNTEPPKDMIGIDRRIRQLIAKQLKITPEQIDVEAPLGQYGLSSIDAVKIAAELEQLTNQEFSPTLIFENPTIESLARVIEKMSCDSVPEKEVGILKRENEAIAIIGIGCRFPGAADVESFWHLLSKGVDTVTQVSESRPSIATDTLNYPNASCRWGAFIDGVQDFDSGFFNISDDEARLMDPQQRKFLEVVWEAIDNAGYAPSNFCGSDTGIFTGVSAGEYGQLIGSRSETVNGYAATGSSLTMLSNRISYLLDIHGPSESIDTACSSSLVAVHRAVQSIRNGECSQAFAGGVNLLLSPLGYLALGKAGFLSADGACKTFDASANGYVRGEGVGALLLKPLSAAIKDNDHIYAVIKGSAINHGGRTASLTAPNENMQAALLKKAYADAGISPATITYIEAHGTGTVLGDPIEINGLKKAFNGAHPSREENQEENTRAAHCGVGSVKSNIGHGEAAAGMAGLIKTALAMKHGVIPATIHFKEQNPHIDLKNSPFYIATDRHEWRRLKDASGNPIARRAGVSSFGFGGTYAHVVLEEATMDRKSRRETAGAQFLPVSAKTPAALDRYLRRFHHFLSTADDTLPDIAATLQTGRDHYAQRLAFVVKSIDDLKALLEDILSQNEISATKSVLFRNGAGNDAEMRALVHTAQSWLQGMKIDWRTLRNGNHAQRIPLPAYQFEKRSFWIKGRQAAQSNPKIGHVAEAGRTFSLEETIQWLKLQAAEHLGVPESEIDPQVNSYEMGLDSIALINIYDRIKARFNLELPISVIQEYPDLESLAKLIAKDVSYEKPDFEKELLLEKEKFMDQLKAAVSVSEHNVTADADRVILLTGATGYLGMFLFRELVLNTEAQIYCLIRARTPAEAEKRLRDTMESFAITDCPLSDRIHPLCGDLGKKKFGIAPDIYDQLCGTIDSVFHCGAVVDWMKPYSALKRSNVGGTIEALKFACMGKIKKLNYISSLGIIPMIEGKNRWHEYDRPEPDALTNGYVQSKWVAEQLCSEARNCGLPVNIFRFDYVAGSLHTGVMKDSDFIVRLIKGCIQIGAIPAEEVNFDILAVDHLSKVVFKIARLNQFKTYHLINRHPFSTCDFTRIIRNFGYKLERIPFENWKQVVKKTPSCELYPLYPFLDQYNPDLLHQFHMARIDNTNVLTALYEIDPNLITDLPSAPDVLTEVMRYFSRQGLLPEAKYQQLLQRQSHYWQQQLQGAPGKLELPFKPRDKKDPETVNTVLFDIEAVLLQRVEQLSLAEEAAVSEILLTVLQILLFRYCRRKDVPVTVPTCVRTGAEKTDMVKMPIIRTILSSGTSFKAVLHCVKHLVWEASANMDLPSDDIGRCLYAEEDGIDKIRYDVIFGYRDRDPAESDIPLNLYPCTVEDVWQEVNGFKLFFEKRQDTLKGALVYRRHRFEESTVRRMIRHFKTLLGKIAAEPNADVSKVPLMEEQELNTIVYGWNAAEKRYPTDQYVYDLIAAQAAARPKAIALRTETEQMTYAELDDKSNQMANYLKNLGVERGELIGMCVDKSFALVIGLLGIMKAGCAYFPIDPAYPEKRKRFMMEDADAKIILTQSSTKDAIAKADAKIICVDEDWETISSGAGHTRLPGTMEYGPTAGKLAYMIYTSGSTGQPKGVRVYHTSLVNMLWAAAEQIEFSPDDCMLTCSSLSFDVSIFELFYPLVNGAGIALLPTAVAGDGQRLKAFLENVPVTFMLAAIPTWRMLDYAGWQGNPSIQLANAGEALPYDLSQTLLGWSKAVYNAYGPTETTVIVTIKRIEPKQPVTIGNVMTNSQIYIVDEFFNPMPIDAYGEVYIGGAGLSQGYHNKPELTEERFISNPFKNTPSKRLYRTGDLACFRSNGEIDYKGRIDTQIKLRGQRIELGEIEHVLTQDDQVKLCAVIMRADPGLEKRIVAYIIPSINREDVSITKIKAALKAMLPVYMVPADYVLMDKFPANSSGKIDRKALPMPGKIELTGEYVPPNTILEAQLADIWEEILNMDKVGIHDSFLDLGGNSILAMKLLIRINKEFNIEFSIQGLFENLTIAEQSEAILCMQATGEYQSSSDGIDFNAEINFDIELDNDTLNSDPPPAAEWRKIFITGTTGFLGVYILQNLLDRTGADIYCLVRAKTIDEGAERIKDKMKSFLIWKDEYEERIKPVVGDLAKPALDISEHEFHLLAEKIDAIYHCGSVVNFSYPYRFLKKTNVGGTKEIIRFAALKKTKHLFYVSTAGVFERDDFYFGEVIKEDDALPDSKGLFFGYSESKWVAEQIVGKARDRGVPISIFRPGSVLGSSVTGISNNDDLVNIIIKVFTMLGAIPDIDIGMNGLPVDFAAESIVSLSMHPKVKGENCNIVNSKVVSARTLIGYLISYGYDLPVLPYEKWREELIRAAENNDFFLPYVSAIETEIAMMNNRAFPKFAYCNTQKLLNNYEQSVPVISEELFHIYLKRLEEIGFIPKPESNRFNKPVPAEMAVA